MSETDVADTIINYELKNGTPLTFLLYSVAIFPIDSSRDSILSDNRDNYEHPPPETDFRGPYYPEVGGSSVSAVPIYKTGPSITACTR